MFHIIRGRFNSHRFILTVWMNKETHVRQGQTYTASKMTYQRLQYLTADTFTRAFDLTCQHFVIANIFYKFSKITNTWEVYKSFEISSGTDIQTPATIFNCKIVLKLGFSHNVIRQTLSNVSFNSNFNVCTEYHKFCYYFSCSKGTKKYSCPRCNLAYCSIDCYKSPNHIKCSEEFFKDCVLEEMALDSKMKSAPGPSDDVKKMYEILKRVENDEPTDSDLELSDDEGLDSDDDEGTVEDDNDLADRLEGIDLNDAEALWSKLTDSERQEFNKIIQSEDVTSILPEFKAWWERKIKRKLVTEMNGDAADEVEPHVEHPKIIESIVDFSRISTKSPAPCVLNNLKNVLAGYSSMVRFFYGEHGTSKHEAVTYLVSICANLRANANFDDSAVAIESIRQDALNEGYAIDEQDARQMKKDVNHLIEGPIQDKQTNTFVLAALSDLHNLFSTVKAEKKQTDSKPSTSTDEANHQNETMEEGVKFSKRFADQKTADCQSFRKGQLTAMIKKIEYYLAFVKKYQ